MRNDDKTYKCSKCGSTLEPEHITTSYRKYMRCVNCNHEKVLWDKKEELQLQREFNSLKCYKLEKRKNNIEEY